MLGISDVVVRLLPASCSRGVSYFPFVFNVEKKTKKSWWVYGGSCRLSNPIGQFVEAHVDDPIRLSGVLIEARVDVPIQPGKAS